MSSPITVKTIISELGSPRMERELRVSSHSVIAARKAGSFPSSWFDVLEQMCIEVGLDCPRSLFNFKPPKATKGKRQKSCPPVKRGAGNDDIQPSPQKSAESAA